MLYSQLEDQQVAPPTKSLFWPHERSFHSDQTNTINALFSSADEAFDGTYPTNVVVTNTGKCTYIPPGIFKSTCKIDITWFPFDDQDCNMKFGSWTYNGFKVNSSVSFSAVQQSVTIIVFKICN